MRGCVASAQDTPGNLSYATVAISGHAVLVLFLLEEFKS